jgi:hypothetical protein
MKKFTLTTFIIFLLFALFSLQTQAQGMSDTQREFDKVEIVNFDVLIYPNPVTDNKFYVKSENIIKSVEVMNVLGQTIKKVNNETKIAYNLSVELGNVKEGMYMVKITFDNKETIIRKIIVKQN